MTAVLPSDLLDDATITFGVTAPREPSVIAELEALGVESFWSGGHIASQHPTPEVITDLAVLSGVTTTAVVGSAVLVLPLYQPVVVAKQLADLDQRTGGRLVLGVGAGGEYPAEFAACGVSPRDRGARLDDGIGLLRHLWEGSTEPWAGTHYDVDAVSITPGPHTPGGPPIIIAGRGGGPMRRAARLGDGWMPHLYSARRYAISKETITTAAAEAGRDLTGFGWMLYVIVSVSHDADRAAAAGRQFLERMVGPDKAEGYAGSIAAIGTPEQVAARLCEYVDVGARHLVFLTVPDSDPLETGELLVSEVMPRVRSHFEQSRGPSV